MKLSTRIKKRLGMGAALAALALGRDLVRSHHTGKHSV